jgi:hypothetical protein
MLSDTDAKKRAVDVEEDEIGEESNTAGARSQRKV